VSSHQQNISEFADSSGTLQTPSTSFTTSIKDINSSLRQFPQEIRSEIQTLAEKYSIASKYWWFDRVNNEIHLYSDNIPDTNVTRDLEGKQIGNYTIHIVFEEGLNVSHGFP
jgi:hypothetical protein